LVEYPRVPVVDFVETDAVVFVRTDGMISRETVCCALYDA
jgi:hypothetical protein